MAESNELVLRRVEDHVAVISLNRPEKRNALNNAMGLELRAAVEWAYSDPEVRCVVLRGEGPTFCAGRDTTELGQRKENDTHFSYVRRAQNYRLAQLDAPKPVIAAVRGYAVGGGFEIVLGADMRVASTDSAFFLPEIRFGILPDTGGTQLLTALIGPSKAKYLVMTGEPIDAQTALDWGVVDWLVPPEEVDKTALELAHKLAAAPPLAIALAKQLVDQQWVESVRSGIRQELVAQVALFESEDYQETRAALREKRTPTYKGK